jgi:hypothetical protein
VHLTSNLKTFFSGTRAQISSDFEPKALLPIKKPKQTGQFDFFFENTFKIKISQQNFSGLVIFLSKTFFLGCAKVLHSQNVPTFGQKNSRFCSKTVLKPFSKNQPFSQRALNSKGFYLLDKNSSILSQTANFFSRRSGKTFLTMT